MLTLINFSYEDFFMVFSSQFVFVKLKIGRLI